MQETDKEPIDSVASEAANTGGGTADPPPAASPEPVLTEGLDQGEEATVTQNGEAALVLAAALRQAELKSAEYQDLWLRAKAESENIRRRAQEDIAKASKFAIDRFARDLLAVRDSLEAALASEGLTVDSLRSGTELTLKQLAAAFEKSALSEINPLGQKFNPHHHQAISVIESAAEPNTVVTVLQKGYLLADRVLRPALVIVAKAGT